MSQGSLRCDANVSVRPVGTTGLGTKTELKNMNSFKFVQDGINAEIARQVALVRSGEEVVQETLHYDPQSKRISSLRSKEEAHDYRYFPEPDLVPIEVTEEMLAAARRALPELPAARAERFARDFGLSPEKAWEFVTRSERADYFEAALSADGAEPVAIANWISLLVERIGPDTDPAESKVTPSGLATLVTMVAAKEVNQNAARDVLTKLVQEGGDPRAIVERDGLGAISADDSGLAEIVARAIAADPDAAAKVREGNQKALGPLVGSVMKETKGRADGGEVRRLILEQVQADS